MTYEVDTWAEAAKQRGIDLDALVATVRDALATHLGSDDVALHDVRVPKGAGTSSTTVLFTATWTRDGIRGRRDLVARTGPLGFQLFREPDFRKQYDVVDALWRSRRVRVAEPLFYEEDPSAIGAPFFVMAQLQGNVPVSNPPYNSAGFLFDATPAQRRLAWETAVDELCRIAVVPVEETQFLARPERGGTPLEQELTYWRDSIDWSCGDETPDGIRELFAWVEAHAPLGDDPGLSWGDARIGNMMFGADFRVAGVMDWEQANIGGVRQDLGWWLFFDEFNADGWGLTRLDGLGTRAETIERWEEQVGARAGDLTWYEVWAGVKVALLSVRSMLLLGSPDARDLTRNLGYVLAARRLGW